MPRRVTRSMTVHVAGDVADSSAQRSAAESVGHDATVEVGGVAAPDGAEYIPGLDDASLDEGYIPGLTTRTSRASTTIFIFRV